MPNSESVSDTLRVKIDITGIVQGVGFRPWVYRHALDFNLIGFVLNDSEGVKIDAQASAAQIEGFIHTLKSEPPTLARIDQFITTKMPPFGSDNSDTIPTSFTIVKSQKQALASVVVSPDKSCCQDCLNEVKDSSNRHYQYPFTNCTNCGPRYSIIKALPYDRPLTAMSPFQMCDQCATSYQDPLDRRYHAQPVSCPNCGPQLSFKTVTGKTVTTKEEALTAAVTDILAGKIIAIKGVGGFHLVCDATNDAAVRLLRERKHRPAKPFAVMVPSIEMAKALVSASDKELEVLSSPERPITLLNKRSSNDKKAMIDISPAIAPNIDKLGLFLPYTPLHLLLLSQLKRPIIATSANRSGEPIITQCEQIQLQLGDVVDSILDHNREIINACDDSVVQLIDGELQILRLARGYAPLSMSLTNSVNTDKLTKPIGGSILAVGAQQKNSIAFTLDKNMILSPHIGDLYSIEAMSYFEKTVATFTRLYQLKPALFVHDKHPKYASTLWVKQQWAKQQCSQQSVSPPKTALSLQHHYAHILSVMAANQYRNPVLGFSFDGTGLGDDGKLWGCEAMLADLDGFTRLAQLETVKLIGNEQAIKDPRRVLLASLLKLMPVEQIIKLNLTAFSNLTALQITNLALVWQKPNHGIETSSAGRLFDLVACALGMLEVTQFEGQAGMLIEAAANRCKQDTGSSIKLTLKLKDGEWQLTHFIEQLLKLITEKPLTEDRKNQIAASFLTALADAVITVAAEYPKLPIVLCGGVFQNRYLHELCIKKLTQKGHHILPSKLIPINDAGIALGQLWYAINHQDDSHLRKSD